LQQIGQELLVFERRQFLRVVNPLPQVAPILHILSQSGEFL